MLTGNFKEDSAPDKPFGLEAGLYQYKSDPRSFIIIGANKERVEICIDEKYINVYPATKEPDLKYHTLFNGSITLTSGDKS